MPSARSVGNTHTNYYIGLISGAIMHIDEVRLHNSSELMLNFQINTRIRRALKIHLTQTSVMAVLDYSH